MDDVLKISRLVALRGATHVDMADNALLEESHIAVATARTI